jgi:hypothetical protein
MLYVAVALPCYCNALSHGVCVHALHVEINCAAESMLREFGTDTGIIPPPALIESAALVPIVHRDGFSEQIPHTVERNQQTIIH